MNVTVERNFTPKSFFTPIRKINSEQETKVVEQKNKFVSMPVGFRSYVNFTGNAPQITKATVVTSTADDITLEKTENGGYIVEPETQTELIYGKDATNFLNKTTKFEEDTQITFPKKAKGKLAIDGRIIRIKENSTVILNKGTEASVIVDKGYPQVIMSKNNYPWYNKYTNKQEQTPALRDKFKELIYRNSHTYNGEFKPCLFSKDDNKNNELATKLKEAGEITEQRSGYVKFERYPVWDYKKGILTSGMAALTVVRDGVPKIKILKEGELAVIPPNTPHCVNSVMGEYEQVVSQIPSAFQYGLSFKQNLDMPYGYTEDQMEEEAKNEMLQMKKSD